MEYKKQGESIFPGNFIGQELVCAYHQTTHEAVSVDAICHGKWRQFPASSVPDWYAAYYNLDHKVFEIQDGDSNEVVVAKGFLGLYRSLDGIADEMTFAEIDRLNELEPILKAAIEVLRARDLI